MPATPPTSFRLSADARTQLAALATAEGTTPRYWLEHTIRAAYAALQTSQGATQREGEQRTHGQ